MAEGRFQQPPVPRTIVALLVLTAVPVVLALLIAPLIWADWIGDDGSPSGAIAVVAGSLVPAMLALGVRRRSRAAWCLLVGLGAVVFVIVLPSPAALLVMGAEALLFAEPTRRHVGWTRSADAPRPGEP